ncbi:Hypothetical predicted protein [Mytilus galloprovincialis]|uniref:Uncharacterized protein n=1 Tax=Mytilus galloprovincialis TaxID=29158 RepID=A0A8B6E7F6_MYTGA|nr:Hypothetical predicted protein [Mytilus galloprovincialis]
MPTSSQALIVITDEGDDPRIPRRHYPATASSYPVLNIGNSDRTSSRSKLPGLKNTTKRSGFQNLVDVKGYRGTISYDATTKALRWLVAAQQTRGNVPLAPNGNVPLAPNGNVPLAPNGNVPLVPNVQTITGTDKAAPPCYIDHTDQWATSRSNNTLEYQASEKRRAQLETLGVRKRTSGLVAGQSSRDITSCSSTVLPKGAKFMPSPPGQKTRPIPVGNYSRDNVGDMCAPNAVNDRLVPKEKKKSLLDELKEAVSYDKRLFPSMHMRNSLPAPSPNSVCFSLRSNEEYTHKEIIDLVKNKTGFKPHTIQYDPVDVRAGNSEVPSRWVVEFGSAAETKSFLQNGLEICGEKVIVKLLDDVHKMEYTAYKLKQEELRKLAERQAMAYVPRKSRRSRTNTTQKSERCRI